MISDSMHKWKLSFLQAIFPTETTFMISAWDQFYVVYMEILWVLLCPRDDTCIQTCNLVVRSAWISLDCGFNGLSFVLARLSVGGYCTIYHVISDLYQKCPELGKNVSRHPDLESIRLLVKCRAIYKQPVQLTLCAYVRWNASQTYANEILMGQRM